MSKIMSLFASILAFAEQGSTVDEWDRTAFDQDVLWGLNGVIYAPPLNIPDVPVPAGALAAILSGWLGLAAPARADMVDMISSQRAYEINSKSVKAADEMSEVATQLIR
jgi:flagellar basal body rod protein FlgF